MTATQPETVWRAGEFGGVAGRRGVLFGRMYEDVAIEQLAFRGRERVFAIASAGCTALALAEHHDVVACDINPAQLAYAQRRMMGAPPEAGAAEQVMRFARRLMPFAGWHEGEVRQFLALERPTEQMHFWREVLNTWRFRMGFDTLLSPKLLRLVYAQPLLDVLPDRFGAVLRSRWERTFARHANRTNPYARALLLGEEAAPLSGGRRVELVEADAAACLEASPPASFDAFTLSNILDGVTVPYEARLWRAVQRAARPDAVVVWRSFAEPPPDLARNFAMQDRSMLWGVVQACRVDELTSSVPLP